MHPTVVGSPSAAEALPDLLQLRKKKRKKQELVFVFPTLPWQRGFFVCLWLSWATKYLLFHSYWLFWKPPWGSPHIYENAGLFKSLYTPLGSCTVWRSSWIFFFLRRKQLYRPKAWSTTADSVWQHLQGETMNTTIPGFPICEDKVSHSTCFLSELCRPR